MNSKFTLALIALVGVGVFALPSTMALFAGQHSFYNIDATGNQIPCVKCHGDVKAELNSGGSTLTGTGGPHANFKCEYCHRSEAGFASGDDAYAKITYSDVAGNASNIYLVTTIGNYETGNFPGTIDTVKGLISGDALTVDTWTGSVFDINDTNAFAMQITNFSNGSAGTYEGKLSNNSVAATVYKFSSAGESALYKSGKPIDTLSTAGTAFNARNVSFNANQTVILDGAGSREVTPGTRYHAASLVSCLECHGGDQYKGVAGYTIESPKPYNHASFLVDKTSSGGCSDCHYGNPDDATGVTDQLMAGGFGLTSYANDTGSVEAHNDFVRGANDGSKDILRNGYGAANDACVACHTHVAVDINFQKKYVLKFVAQAQKSSPLDNDSWKIGGFSAQGTVDVEEFGNGTGGAFATGNHTYNNWVPGTNMYLVSNNGTLGTNAIALNSSQSNDSAAALTQ